MAKEKLYSPKYISFLFEDSIEIPHRDLITLDLFTFHFS